MTRTRMLALSAGIMLAALLPVDSGQLGHWVMLPGLAAAGCLWRLNAAHSPRFRACLSLFVCVLIGAGYALWRAHLYAERLLPTAWEGHDLWVYGRVTGLPSSTDVYRTMDFRVQHACLALLPENCGGQGAGFSPRLIELSVYDETLILSPGQRWWLRVRLRRPRGTVNPGIGGREAQWFRRGVAARGYVRETAFNHQDGVAFLDVDRWRHWLLRQMRLPGAAAERQGLVNALVVGDRSGISDRQWQLFNDTGTSHLVVISGLHIAFVAWTVYGASGWLLRRMPRWLFWPAPVTAGYCALAVAVAYAALAGFSLPTRRALIMLVVGMAGRLSGRQFPVSLGFCVALLLVLLLDPLAVVSAGFWYSFTAVGVLLLAFSGRRRLSEIQEQGNRVGRIWEQWGRAQWVVFIGLLVPMTVWNGNISLLSPLANVLAIPFVSLVVVPLCLLAAVLTTVCAPLGQPLVLAASLSLQWLEGSLAWLRAVAGALTSLSLPVLPLPALACVGLAVLLLLMPRGWPLRGLAGPLLLPLMLGREPVLPAEAARVLVADVGQGLGLIIQTRNHTMVYDTGPGPVLMSRLLEHRMRALGHERLHAVILSHGHSDHSGGLEGIRARLQVDHWLSGGSLKLPESVHCAAGRQWSLDGVQLRFLHPPRGAALDPGENENNRSCVLHVRAGDDSMLITGDIERSVEEWLVAEQAKRLRADVLLVPHHGSRSSSSAGFLDAVQPALAVYSAAYNNRFAHPADEVLDRYEARGVHVLGTPEAGAIRLCLGHACPGEWLEFRYRKDQPRYWRRPATSRCHAEKGL